MTPRLPDSAKLALERLKAGNARFISREVNVDARVKHLDRGELAKGQAPVAAILACADSRAPMEILFDEGFGDLFVVRVAGNVVAPSIVGSLEFAVGKLGVSLVVVCGHSNCGAVSATLAAVQGEGGAPTDTSIGDIVERIRPSVAELVHAGLTGDVLLQRAVRANVRLAADHLRHGSTLLERRVLGGELGIIGAEYQIETGKVEFFEEPGV